jgi:hypothetical protein
MQQSPDDHPAPDSPAALLALSAIAAAQTAPPHLNPGWYRNSGPAIIHEDSELKITWENSYVYPYPGRDALYWYAQVVYLYKGSATFDIRCVPEGFQPVGEHMRGTPHSGFVAAEETFCSRNRDSTITLKPGEAFYDWVIFHNVPWIGGQVLLEWPAYESWQEAQWVDPWNSLYPSESPPPPECPTELVTLGTCHPGGAIWPWPFDPSQGRWAIINGYRGVVDHAPGGSPNNYALLAFDFAKCATIDPTTTGLCDLSGGWANHRRNGLIAS